MWTPQGLFCVFFFSSLFYLHSLAQFTETMRDAMANGDKLCRCILYLQCTYFCAMLFGSPIAMHNVKCTKTFAVHTVSAVGKLCVPAAWPRQSNIRLVIIATTILCAYVAVRIRACAVAVASRFASWFNGFFYIYIYVNLLALFCLLNLKVYLISKLR